MGLFRGLSGRLLVLTVLVVMLVEVVIFVPSVARFRVAYLEERIARAQIASLAVLAAPDSMVTEELERELLNNAEVVNIVLHRDGSRALMLSRPEVPDVSASFDLRRVSVGGLIVDALARLAAPDGATIIRVIGTPPHGGGEAIEITLDAEPLRLAMLDYGWRILKLSLIISLITATVVFLLIRRLVVGPLIALINNVKDFQANPEDPARIIRPGRHSGEIAEAERAVAEMQEDVLHALRERTRLASLGEAVAKISHDLRNMLSSLQLMVDRLETSEDPMVSRVMPKILGSLDRAIRLCQRTLDYGRAEEAEPVIRQVELRGLAEEACEGLGLTAGDGLAQCRIDIPAGCTVPADPEQLYRVLANLLRNAAEAIAESGVRGEIRITASRSEGGAEIRIADTGPGLPARALENLFTPFRGGARRGGTGLGLAIAHELVAAQGGRLELVSSTTAGTEFRILLPSE